MADVEVTVDTITVTPTRVERLFGLKGPVEIPMRAVRGAMPVGDPMSATRGGRIGAHVPTLSKVGTWGIGVGARQLVFAYRGRPGLHVELDRSVAGYDDLIVSVDDADALAAEIRRRIGRGA